VTGTMPPTVFDSPEFPYMTSWEQLPPGWQHPDATDVAVVAGDRLVILCRNIEQQVQICDADGELAASWGHAEFVRPHGITAAPDETLYITDDGAHAVFRFTLEGELLQIHGRPGQPGELDGVPFNRPTAVAVASTGDLYIADGYGNSHVHCFAPDGDLRFSWGGPGGGGGTFKVPHAIVVTEDDRLIVADRDNALIQIFDLSGAQLDQWALGYRPMAVALHPSGRLVVAEVPLPGADASTPKSRLAVYDEDGRLLAWTAGGDYAVPGSFYAVHGICIDSRANIYLAEVNGTAAGYYPGPQPSRPSVHKLVRTQA
jgi:hypothetical protein